MTALHALLILAVVFVSSFVTLGHGFVFDDHMLIGGNSPVITGEAPLSSAFTYRYWGVADEASPNELYRPITIASIGINARILGQEPWGMHAVNILLHAINALLVYCLVQALFSRPVLSLLTALVFALHPIATEAVAPIAGRADLLATCFLLISSLCALVACRQRGRWILGCGLLLAAVTFMGALSKESFFAAPLVIAAVLGSDVRRRRKGDPTHYRHYLATAATFAGIQVFVLLMVFLLRYQILGYVYHSDPPTNPSTAYLAFVNNPIQFAAPLGRIFTALRVAVSGAGLLLLPFDLAADYSYNAIPVSTGMPGLVELGALCFLLIYMGLTLYSARRSPVVMLALAWSAMSYLIVSNLLFPIGTIFGERLLYTPSIGFALLVAAALTRLGGVTPRRRLIACTLAVLLLGLYATRFVTRCRDWVDDEHLFKAAVASHPASAKAHANYAFTLLRAGRTDEALTHYSVALEIAPGLTGSGISLARILTQKGRNEEAVKVLNGVIQKDDGISVAYSALGLAQEGAGNDTEAEKGFRKALELSFGQNREAIFGLARVMTRTGREAQGVDLLERMAKNAPDAADVRGELAQARYLLGVRRFKEGDLAGFTAAMMGTIELDPDHGPAHYNLAVAALEAGDKQMAREHAVAALKSGYELPPGFLEACGITGTPR